MTDYTPRMPTLPWYLIGYKGDYIRIRELYKKQMRKLDPYWHYGDYCRMPYWKHRANNTAYT